MFPAMMIAILTAITAWWLLVQRLEILSLIENRDYD